MKDLKEVKERYSVNVRLSKTEAEQLQEKANKELLSLSAFVRRSLFLNAKKSD